MLRNARYDSPMIGLSMSDLNKGIDAIDSGRYAEAGKLFESSISSLESGYYLAHSVHEKVALLDLITDEAKILTSILYHLSTGIHAFVKTNDIDGEPTTFVFDIPVSALGGEARRFIPSALNLAGNALTYVNDNAKLMYDTDKLSRWHKRWASAMIFTSKLLYTNTACISMFNDIGSALDSDEKMPNIEQRINEVSKLFDSAINDRYEYRHVGFRSKLNDYVIELEALKIKKIEKYVFKSISQTYGVQLPKDGTGTATFIEKALRRIDKDIDFRIESLDNFREGLMKSVTSSTKAKALASTLPLGVGVYAFTQGNFALSTLLMTATVALEITSLARAKSLRSLLRRHNEDD
ncbi:MAG: hypothetical protein ACP5MZ_00775 [Candidatus Micrarchaeia archaeon]